VGSRSLIRTGYALSDVADFAAQPAALYLTRLCIWLFPPRLDPLRFYAYVAREHE
jgi:hypothetical protein